jgi:Protein of unknown function (DUF3800)
MFAFVDETGNTGENLFDEKQPLFITAALITKSDFDILHKGRMTKLARRVVGQEIHAHKLGIARIEEIAGELLTILKHADAKFFLSRVEKRYLATTKVVDTIFDSGENHAVPWHVYNLRPLRLLLVFKVAYLLDEAIVREFWACLMDKNEKRAYERFVAFCERLLGRVQALPDERSRQVVGEAVEWARENPEAIYLHSSGKLARYAHLPNMVAFTNLLEGLEMQSQAWHRPVRKIRHDRQMQFEKSLAYWHEIFANASPDPLYMPFGERHVFRKVFGSEFIISSAKESAGIQAIDIVLWLFKRVLNGEDVPPNSARLIQFVFRRARQHDFSFLGVSTRLKETFDDIWGAQLSDEQWQRGQELLVEFEEGRQEKMIEYAETKHPNSDG